jgi:hypothetical protein
MTCQSVFGGSRKEIEKGGAVDGHVNEDITHDNANRNEEFRSE